MHIKGKSSWIKHFDFIVLNLISLILSLMIAYYIRFDNLEIMKVASWRTAFIVMLLINIIITLLMNPYSGIFRRPYYEDAIKLLFFTAYSFTIVSIIFYVLKVGAVYSRITIILTFALHYVTAFLFIYIRKKMLLSGKVKGFSNRKRKLFIVTQFKDIEDTIANILASDMPEYEIAGFSFTDGLFEENQYMGKDNIDIEQAADYIVTENIDDVFITTDSTILSKDSYKKIIDNGVSVHLDIESMIGIEGDDQFISRVGIYKTASIGPYAFDGRRMAYLAIKRFFDVIIGLIGCILLIPIMVVVKISNILSGDYDSIFYCQTRVGRHGKTFKLYKFRTMIPNADKALEELLKQEEYRKQWELNQKIDGDPRITKIGHILRRTSLDEAPQFINMIKGDMSLIGPRPLVVGELAAHDGLTLYNRVKPGITGWWACNGRSNISYRERLGLEYYYVKNCSFYLDVVCIVRTILAIVKREGAR